MDGSSKQVLYVGYKKDMIAYANKTWKFVMKENDGGTKIDLNETGMGPGWALAISVENPIAIPSTDDDSMCGPEIRVKEWTLTRSAKGSEKTPLNGFSLSIFTQ